MSNNQEQNLINTLLTKYWHVLIVFVGVILTAGGLIYFKDTANARLDKLETKTDQTANVTSGLVIKQDNTVDVLSKYILSNDKRQERIEQKLDTLLLRQ